MQAGYNIGDRDLAAIPSLKMRQAMFDTRCDLAALIYEAYQEPDAILHDFASDLNARGFRSVDMIQAGRGPDSSLSVVMPRRIPNMVHRRNEKRK
jgi:hypothetical protein